MKQILLAAVLILAPVALFSGINIYLRPAVAVAAPLGDMAPFEAIITDVERIAESGDLAAAEHRITDFETAWDDDESTLRPLNKNAWSNIDESADGALHALRSHTPDAAEVKTTLAALKDVLKNPSPGEGGSSDVAKLISGIAISDNSGHYLPCEEMLTSVRQSVSGAALSDADKATVASLQAKAIERCNSDDDQHADEFSAKALAILPH